MKTRALKHRISFFVLCVCLFSLLNSAAAESNRAEYYKGLDLYREKNYSAAVTAFEAQLKVTPDDTAVKRWFTKASKRAAHRRTSSVANLFEEGVVLYQAGNLEKARDSFSGYLKENPDDKAAAQWLNLTELRLSQPSAPLAAPDLTPAVSTRAAMLPALPGTPQFAIEQISPLRQIPPAPSQPLTEPAGTPDLQAGQEAVPESTVAPERLNEAEKTLSLREKQLRRSIEQTKRALHQTQKSENINREFSSQIEALQTERKKLSEDLAAKDTEVREIRDSLSLVEKKLSQSAHIRAPGGDGERQIRSVQNKLAETRTLLKKARREIEKRRERLSNSERERAELAALYRNAELERQNFAAQNTSELDEFRRRLEHIKKSFMLIVREKDSLENEMRTLSQNHKSLLERVSTLEAALSSSEREKQSLRAAADREIFELKTALDQKIVTQTREEQSAFVQKISALRTANEELSAALDKYRRDMGQLRVNFSQEEKRLADQTTVLKRVSEESQKTLLELSLNFQSADHARLTAEKELAKLIRNADALKNENTALRQVVQSQRNDSEKKSKELEKIDFSFRNMNALLIQSQNQNAQLSQQLAREQALREGLELQIRQQLSQTLPQLESMSSSLNRIQQSIQPADDQN